MRSRLSENDPINKGVPPVAPMTEFIPQARIIVLLALKFHLVYVKPV